VVSFLDVLPRMTEARWQAQVLTLARMFGWRTYHVFDSRRSVAGFPDLVLVRRPRVIFAELKAPRGRLTVDQKGWLAELRECTVETYVWRPDDLDRVMEVLR
jgi:hypothetical protein